LVVNPNNAGSNLTVRAASDGRLGLTTQDYVTPPATFPYASLGASAVFTGKTNLSGTTWFLAFETPYPVGSYAPLLTFFQGSVQIYIINHGADANLSLAWSLGNVYYPINIPVGGPSSPSTKEGGPCTNSPNRRLLPDCHRDGSLCCSVSVRQRPKLLVRVDG
jgi:hypothetical protein